MPAPTMKKLIRPVHRGDSGPDILAIKRALDAAGYGRYLVKSRSFGSGLERQVRRYQKNHALPVDGVYGQKTHDLLYPHFDDYGRELLANAPKKSKEEIVYAELLSIMAKCHRDTPGYVWGGGHSKPLAEVKTTDGMDCSGSTSYVLWFVKLFIDDWAWISGRFASSYANDGKGKMFTVYASGDHVWIRLYKGPYWRFDTSPHGDGGRGPKLRKLPRFTFGFTARHWKGY